MKNKKDDFSFPENFYWGSSTSSHQVEGGNVNDWSEWEKNNAERLAKEAGEKWQDWQKKKFPEMFEEKNYISGKACDHYNRFEEDFDIVKSLNQNAHRFSIEWSRIEPEEGKFNKKEIEHYRKVILALKARRIEQFVTLWHWTFPLWLAKKGGAESSQFPSLFSRYVEKVVSELGKEVNFWITLNEPNTFTSNCFLRGLWPPEKKNPVSALSVYKNLAKAHNQAYKAIKKINPKSQVSFSVLTNFVEPKHKFCVFDQAVSRIYRFFTNEKFYRMTIGNRDFSAVQYYFYNRIRFYRGISNEDKEVSDLGWEIYPKGLYHVLKEVSRYEGNANLPIYITENGLADSEDEKRSRFIRESLENVAKAMRDGIDVRGYFYWSLLDNFEWDKGFWPRFGLVEVDYRTMERRIRASALDYGKICGKAQSSKRKTQIHKSNFKTEK